jgi:hypothetical protein
MTPQQTYLDDIDRMLIDVRNRIGIAADKADFLELHRLMDQQESLKRLKEVAS